MTARLTARARRDLDKILQYSVREYGHDAANRYELLLTIAIEEIGNDPLLRGSREVRRRPGVRTYSISHSRAHVPKELRVRSPAHQLLYRLVENGIVEILAITGDGYPAGKVAIPKA